MERRTNILGTVSLVCSITLIVCYFLGMCVGMIPIVGMVIFILIPVEWLLAIVGLATGIAGYFQSKAMDGAGAVPAMIGALISGLWLLLQIVLLTLVFLGVGGMLLLSMVAVMLDA